MDILQADTSGVLTGKFTIPEGIPAGAKRVTLTGSGGSRGEATFTGEGTLLTQTFRRVTTVTETRWQVDPLAQTFMLDAACQIGGVDLWFTKRGTSTVLVQLRNTTVGQPNREVLGEARLAPKDILLDGPTRITFGAAVSLAAATEFALVVLCDDAETEIAIAEIGKWDTVGERWIGGQPYQIGVLLSSSNASTWTAHQDKDMTFRLLRAEFTTTERIVELGSMNVAELSDIMILGLAEQPAAQARVEYRLALPGGTVFTVQDGQPLRLENTATGEVRLTAHMIGGAGAAPVLHPGTQVITGSVSRSADYVTRAIPAGPGANLRVIFEAFLEGAATVDVLCLADGASGTNVEGTEAGEDWTPVPRHASTPGVSEGWLELEHRLPVEDENVRVKLVLSGSSRFRPRIRNLRVLTV